MDDGKKASKVMVNTILTDVLVILDIVIMLFGWFWLMLSDDLVMLIVGLMIFGTFYAVGFTATFFALKKGREYAMQADFAEEIRNNDNIAAIFLAVYNVIAAILFIAKMRAMFAGVGYFIMCIIWEMVLFFIPLFILIKYAVSIDWRGKISKNETKKKQKGELDMSFLSKLSEMKETTKNKMEELKAWDEKISWTCFVIHIMGLPLMQNIECEVFFDEDKLTITASEQTFNLSYSKIYSIDILNEKNLRLKESQFVSSVGGAIGGAALFGTVGAIIGGRIKEKRVKADYMVITYKKNDAVDYIVLENAIKFDTSSLAMKKCIEKAKNSGLFIKHDTVEL